MSTQSETIRREPKRQRGRLRVAAIMEAGAEVFMQRGYDAATMTEIAARSKTAIGSLYRFFPTKELLAEALLLRFADLVVGELDELRETAQDMPVDRLAGALVDFMMKLYRESSFAIRLADAGGDKAKRQKFRKMLLAGMESVIANAAPDLKQPKREVAAKLLLHLLKGVAVAAETEPRTRGLVMAELRMLVQHYLLTLKGA